MVQSVGVNRHRLVVIHRFKTGKGDLDGGGSTAWTASSLKAETLFCTIHHVILQ